MKSRLNNIWLILFIFVFSLSCLLMSRNNDSILFGFNSIACQVIKSVIVFCAVFTLTILNKNNIDKVVNYCFGYIIVISVAFIVDYYFTNISGALYNQLLWLSIIHIAILAVYIGLLSLKDINFNAESAKLIKGYTVLFAAAFLILFIRPIGDGATMNFIIGKGTFIFVNIIKNKPYLWTLWFVLIGNFAYFIPLPFILKTFFPKLSTIQTLLLGFAIPIMIESYQFIFKCGDVDVDDIVLNVSGFVVGMILLKVQNKLKKQEV